MIKLKRLFLIHHSGIVYNIHKEYFSYNYLYNASLPSPTLQHNKEKVIKYSSYNNCYLCYIKYNIYFDRY